MNIVDIFTSLSDWVTGIVFYAVPLFGTEVPLIVAWLVLAGAFFTVYLGFMQVRGPTPVDRPGPRPLLRPRTTPGEVSHFQALATAVSGTVGPGQHRRRRRRHLPRWPRSHVLDDRRRPARHGHQDGRVHARREVPPRARRRVGLRRADVLPARRPRRAWHGRPGQGPRRALRHLHGRRRARRRQHVPVQPGHGPDRGTSPAGRQHLRGLAAGSSGCSSRPLRGAVIIGGIKSIARVTEKVVPFMAVLYLTACVIVIFAQPQRRPWRLRGDPRRRVHRRGRRGRGDRCAHRGVPAGRLLERGRVWARRRWRTRPSRRGSPPPRASSRCSSPSSTPSSSAR